MLSLLLNKVWGYVLGAGALLIAVLAALGLAKRAGVKQEQAAETEKALQQSKESNEIDTQVRALSESDLDKQLRRDQRD